MKKILLSSFVVFSFAVYSLYGRILNSPAPITNTVTDVVKQPDPIINNNDSVGYEVMPPQQKPIPVITSTPVVVKPKPIPVPVQTGKFKNGNYTGDIVDASYGYVQVVAIISGGKITDVQFLDYPQDRPESLRKSTRAMPVLISEAIAIQDSNVDTVSGASFTSQAYRESLASALAQAKM